MAETEEDAYLCCTMPPLFAMPEELTRTLSEQNGNESLISQWEQCFNRFRKNIKKQHLTLMLPDPEYILSRTDVLRPAMSEIFSDYDFIYTKEQYGMHIEQLQQLEKRYENLKVIFASEFSDNTLIYVKENTGVIVEKSNTMKTAFVITDKNMVSAFWDYVEKHSGPF